MRTLRDYQLEALSGIDAGIANGQLRGVVALATGLGKTVTAANAIKRRINLGRALFTAPLDAVVNQSAASIQSELDGVSVGIVKAQLNQVNSRVAVASLQTLARQRRIDQLADSVRTHGEFKTIVIDECHLHLDAYKKVIDRLATSNTLVCGLTATPERGDGRGLGEVFETVYYEMGVVEGIRQGWLVEPDALQFRLKGADFSNVHIRKGDLDAKELEDVMKSANFAEQITKHWQEHAGDKRTVVFLRTVKMAYELAEFMRARGIRAEALDGETGKSNRREIFKRYESGETQLLCNVLVLSTGWDSPITECLVMARPTTSKALYIQAMGRGLRTLKGVIDGHETAEARLAAIAASAKPNCLVMDMIGVTGKHKLMTLVDLMGVKKPTERRKMTELVEDAENEKREEEQRLLFEAELEAQRVKLIEDQKKALTTCPKCGGERSKYSTAGSVCRKCFEKKESRFNWQDQFASNKETLYAKGAVLTLRQMADGATWIVTDNHGKFRFVGASAEACKLKAEEYAKSLLFSDKDAAWRNKPASEKQVELLRKKKFRITEGLTMGEASDLISQLFNRKKEVNQNV